MSKISKIRALSEACWEQAADEPRDEASAAKFIFDWDQWGAAWDAAEEALEEGDLAGARAELERCRALEAEYGDDSHARRAIAHLEGGAL